MYIYEVLQQILINKKRHLFSSDGDFVGFFLGLLADESDHLLDLPRHICVVHLSLVILISFQEKLSNTTNNVNDFLASAFLNSSAGENVIYIYIYSANYVSECARRL